MDSAVLGLASPVTVDIKGTALGLQHDFENSPFSFGFHSFAPLEALPYV
jgi:hypothetical protein